jgi:hypothetical protein
MACRKCQTSTATPAKPRDLLCLFSRGERTRALLAPPRRATLALKRSSDNCVTRGPTDVIRDAHLTYEYGLEDGYVLARADRNPSAAMMRDPVRSAIHVSVCGACGYFEQHAATPESLLDAWRQAGN